MTGRGGVAAHWLLGLLLTACAVPSEPPAATSRAPLVIEDPAGAGTEHADPVAPAAMAPSTVVAEPVEPVVEATAPVPVPFEGLEVVPLSGLVAELERVAEELEEVPAVREDYAAFLATHGLADGEALYHDYVRVKLVFESTRDGGLWHLRWDITNESPNSEQIWRQWKRAKVSEGAAMPTAFAECDELSALFAFLVYRLGVRHVGLYWPQWNHVVAVWTVRSPDDAEPVRVVVPTSQIFLTDEDSLGTKGFDPWSQRTIYEYRRRDVKTTHAIDAELARFFVTQARRYAGLPQLELQRLRNARDRAMGAALAERGGG